MYKIKLSCILHVFLAGYSCLTAQPAATFNVKGIRVKWELHTNDFLGTGSAQATFTLKNLGKSNFPASGWTIYFNSSQPVREGAATGNVIISHVNGDIFKLSPSEKFQSVKKNDSVRVTYFTDGRIANYTATPAGLYIVWDKEPGKGYSITDYSVMPLLNPVPGIVSPEKLYQQNAVIRELPLSALPKILPTPVYCKENPGQFILSYGFVLTSDPAFSKEAEYLREALESRLQKPFADKTGAANNNSIQLVKQEMGVEAYQLEITAAGITVKAGTGQGMFYGIQSLLSLLPAAAGASVSLPLLEVNDQPRFGYRSLLIDIARNFKPKQALFKILDLMAAYKMNVLQLHFSDDEGWRIEIPSLPELTEIGAVRGHTTDSKNRLPPSYAAGPVPGASLGTGYYTKADFVEILKYATQRHIRVIPEIETPGHARAAIKAMDVRYEKFMKQGNREEAERYLLRDVNDRSVYSSAQQWTDNVICVALPSVYTFLDKVMDELQTMYKEAGAPLSTIHLGGDEVPAGAWEKSPRCQALIQQDPQLAETNDLWYYYYASVNTILQARGMFLSAWEEAGLRKTKLDGKNAMIVNPRFANEGIQLNVWNNVTGWGAEDLPYRLANAGYKVVLSPVTNNYLDLAYYKHPDEPGYYWGGYVDIDKPFYFIPYDYYKTSKEDPEGNPVSPSVFTGKDRLTDFGKSNIVGIQGLLWAENLRTVESMEYLLLPKMLAVAERAWAPDPEWATEKDSTRFQQLYNQDWSRFLNQLGKRELPRLDQLAGGFNYRIPAAGAIVENGQVLVNCQFPGLIIRYTTDGSEPVAASRPAVGTIKDKGVINIRVFDSRGRGGRTITVENK